MLDVAIPLQEDVLFKCSFLGEHGETELEEIDVGNGPGLPIGLLKFKFEVTPPSQSQLMASGVFVDDRPDVCAVAVSALYRGREFCRVGYYYRLEYNDPNMNENPPTPVQWSKLCTMLSNEPKVTRYPIKWDPTQDSSTAETEN